MWPSGNCAVRCKGAWWYNVCYQANLNGLYQKKGQITDGGINWLHGKNDLRPMKEAEMKTRPAQY